MAYDDMITLSGCGVITQWHFPMNIKYCPARGCGKRFKARLNAINHYRDKHAHVCFLCTICDKPFAGRYPSDIKQHYKRFHSKASIPTVSIQSISIILRILFYEIHYVSNGFKLQRSRRFQKMTTMI